MEFLAPREIEEIEQNYSGGVPARIVVDIFRPKGIRLSEATFRKYVQTGLLPRSRRVGRKGKHRGSRGLYPVEVVRRINAIKKMMHEGHTLEDIRRSFVFFKNHIDQVERGLMEVLGGFQTELSDRPIGQDRKRELEDELLSLRLRAQELVRDVARVGSAVTAHLAQQPEASRYSVGA